MYLWDVGIRSRCYEPDMRSQAFRFKASRRGVQASRCALKPLVVLHLQSLCTYVYRSLHVFLWLKTDKYVYIYLYMHSDIYLQIYMYTYAIQRNLHSYDVHMIASV